MSINFDNFNNIVSMFFEQSKKMKDKPYLWKKNNDNFESLSWGEVELSVKSVARSLIDLGILKGDRVIILSENRPEWQIADLAIMSIGAITVPAYTTSTSKDYEYIIKHSGARCVIVSNHELAKKVFPAVLKSQNCQNFTRKRPSKIKNYCKNEWKISINYFNKHKKNGERKNHFQKDFE